MAFYCLNLHTKFGRTVDTYTFDREIGDKYFFNGLQGDSDIKLRLYSPSNKLIIDDDTVGNLSPFTLTENGKYSLEIDGSSNGFTDTIGAYEFIFSQMQQTDEITLGESTSGKITNNNQVDLYQLNGRIGQQIKIDLATPVIFNPETGNYYTLTDTGSWTDTQQQAEALGGNLVTINSANENQFLVDAFGGSELFWIGLTDEVEEGNFQWVNGEPITYTNWVSGDPNNFGGNENYGVINAVNIGQWVDLPNGGFNNNPYRGIVEIDSNSFGNSFNIVIDQWIDSNWTFSLYDPSGAIIETNVNDFTTALPSTGIYTLAVSSTNLAAINYEFQVNDTTPTPVITTQLGTLQSNSLATGEIDSYTFSSNAGTKVYLDSSSSNFNIRIRLINPDGSEVFTNHDSRYDRNPITLQQTGDYTVEVYGVNSNITGNYSYQFIELPNRLQAGTNYLEIGQPTSGSVNSDTVIYSFQGVEGLPILFNGIEGVNVTATLYDPNGNQVFSRYNFQASDQGVYTLDQEGWYHLAIAGNGNENIDRPYNFQLLELSSGEEIDYNLPVTDSLADGRLSQAYRFYGNGDDTLYLDSILGQGGNGNVRNDWQLYDPGYNLIYDGISTNNADITLPIDGEYTLVFTGSNTNSNPVDYEFRLFAYEPTANDIITPGTGEESGSGTEQDSLGLYNVQLQVEDGKGGVGLQDYQLRVWADPTNSNPVIISTPETLFALDDEVYQYQLQSIDADGDDLTYRIIDAPLGAVIDSQTGELLWFPENLTTNDTVEFTVEVSDGRGGKDIQTFTVEVVASLGKIQGAVFDDLNRNGFLDTKLLRGEDPSIVLAIDVSGSTAAPFYGSREYPDVETVLDAQIAASLALVDSIIAQDLGDRVKIAVIPHRNTVTLQDLDPVADGVQVFTTALADADNNGVADIRQILESYISFGSNDFNITLDAVQELVEQLPGDPNVIFMSDGYDVAFERDPNAGQEVLDNLRNSGININAFAIGEYSTVETLKRINPEAERIVDIERLVRIFTGFDPRYALEPFKEGVTVYLDLNENGTWELDEPYQLTQIDNSNSVLGETQYYFTFDGLLPGDYTLRQIVPTGFEQTTPREDYVDTVTVAGETFTHLLGVHEIDDTIPNQNPEFLTTPPTFILRAGETLRYDAIAQDPDADPITYNLVLNPEGMVVDAEGGNVVWTPTKTQVDEFYRQLEEKRRQLGPARAASVETTVTFNVLLTADDGNGGKALQYINIEVLPENHGPLFTSINPDKLTAQIDKPFEYQAKAYNSDDDPITYALGTGTPLGVSIDANTGLLTWTPTSAQVGEQRITVIASDSQGATVEQTLPFNVIEGIPNNDPVIVSVPRTTARIDTAYIYQVVAEDADNNPIDYTLLEAPQGMVMDEQGRIFWTPFEADLGDTTVTVQVDDGQGGTDVQSYTLTVRDQLLNRPPTITSTPELITNLDRTYVYEATAVDPDGDYLFWQLNQSPEGMIIDPDIGVISWQPDFTDIGENTVIIEVIDPLLQSATQEFTLKVTGQNTPPNITSNPVTQVGVTQTYRYDVEAQDPENDPLTYSFAQRPEGMTIDAETGVIEWQPTEIGSYEVEVTVTDTQGGLSRQLYTVEVITQPINQAPVITSTPGLRADIENSYTYQIIANDPDGDSLTYQLIDAPVGMTINSNTGVVTWQPNSNQLGVNSVTVAAYDPQGLGAIQSYKLAVLETNNAPLITSLPKLSTIVGGSYAYDVKAVDPDGDTIAYSLINAPDGITLDQLGRIRWTPEQGDIDSYPIEITVTDERGLSTTQTYTLTVIGDTEAPEVSLGFNNTRIELGQGLDLQVSAIDNVGVENITLVVGTTPLSLNPGVFSNAQVNKASITLDSLGTYQVVATAVDAAGNVGTQTVQVEVVLPDTQAPVINIDESVFKDKYVLAQGAFAQPEDYQLTLSGSLDVVQSQNNNVATFTGNAAVSSDALGTVEGGGILEAEILAGSTIERAYLHLGTLTNDFAFRPNTVTFEGQTLGLTWLDNVQDMSNFSKTLNFEIGKVDVTDIVANKVGNSGGIFEFNISEDLGISRDLIVGSSLTVIYSNPDLPESTIVLLEGGAIGADPRITNLTFENPLDLTNSQVTPQLSLGILFSDLQDRTLAQYTSVDINGDRLTSSAGDYDDGQRENYALVTVGGVGDKIDNPDDPYSIRDSGDDELYNLTSFLQDGDTQLTIETRNPSNDDLLYLMALTLPASVSDIEVSQPKPFGYTYNKLLTANTDIVVAIEDENLSSYRVEYAPISLQNDPNAYTTLATGTNNVDGVIAQIDPKTIENGDYQLRVVAIDDSGNVSVDTSNFSIGGENKPRRFELEFVDLSVPLTGIPIEIYRRYDSLESKISGDFGHGWSLGIQDARIEETSARGFDLGGIARFFDLNPMAVGDRVTLTTPNGERVGFTFEPQFVSVGAGRFLGESFYVWRPYFRPDPGVYHTLEVDYMPLNVQADGSTSLNLFGFSYNPNKYRLITKEGITYEYDQYQGLQTVTDRNDNVLTYKENGIFSSTGQSILFNRDPQGRIIEIIDPEGNSIEYSYDVNGDLVSVEDRTDAVTTFKYEDSEPHYLTEIIDPLGRQGVRTEYDTNGQLSRLIDADGNAIDLSYVSADSTQTVRDPLGFETTYVFDTRGNVVQEVDALGGIITRTFDENDNLLSETDQEGNTTTYTYDNRSNVLT